MFDFRGLHIVAEKWADPMGRLSIHDERPADCTGQAASRHRRKLKKIYGKVPVLGDGEGGKGHL